MMKCSDVLNRDALYCLPSDGLSRVAEIMASRYAGPALVIEDKLTRKLAGIVTDRDLVVKVLAAGLDPRTTQVRDVMARNVVSVHADQDLEQAVAVMNSMHLQQIPVLDSSNRVVGLLTYQAAAQRLFVMVKSKALVNVTALAGAAINGNGATKWEQF